MRYKITCPFLLISSHEIESVGFRGGNNLELTTPFNQNNPFGVENSTLEINQLAEGKYNICAISSVLNSEKKQIEFLENVAEYISFLINKTENNPHYGNIFVKIEWLDFKVVPQCDDVIASDETHHVSVIDRINISDAVTMSSTRTCRLSNNDWDGISHNDLLRFYFDGLKAEHKKSKYFHWFLILECLEKSQKYKAMFNEKLFNDFDEQQIRELAEKISSCHDDSKKGALLGLLSRTKESRNAKLLKMLNGLNVNSYKSFGMVQCELVIPTVSKIVDGRNKLFHSGTTISDDVLWCHLFPIVTLVVEYVSKNPNCLNK
jgi:hypothetical protein